MNRIKEEIKLQGETITSVAQKMGISRESLSRMIVSPSMRTLDKLSKVLNVPVWRFFATKQDVIGDGAGEQSIVCPKCGEVIKVTTKIKK